MRVDLMPAVFSAFYSVRVTVVTQVRLNNDSLRKFIGKLSH